MGNRLGRGRIALCRSGVKQLRGGRDFRLYQRKRTHWPEGNLLDQGPGGRYRRRPDPWRRSRCRRIDNDRHGRSIKHLLDCAARRAGRHKDGAVRPLHHTDNDQRRGNACRHLHERGIHPLRRHQRSALRPRHRQQDQDCRCRHGKHVSRQDPVWHDRRFALHPIDELRCRHVRLEDQRRRHGIPAKRHRARHRLCQRRMVQGRADSRLCHSHQHRHRPLRCRRVGNMEISPWHGHRLAHRMERNRVHDLRLGRLCSTLKRRRPAVGQDQQQAKRLRASKLQSAVERYFWRVGPWKPDSRC